ncbi:MAG: hypothetical protein GQ574_01560 [Crocinitomix sp.]|nr:hypothetical protein [Crocinitomix sp.]
MTNSQNNSKQAFQDKMNRIGYNDTPFILKLIKIFSENAKSALENLNQTSPISDLVLKQQVAHKLKSNFQLFEYVEAEELASKIENASTLDEMKPYLKRLNKVLPAIMAELETFD